MSTGWVKLHRQLLDWEWYSDVNTTRVFLHLLLVANHKDNNWRGIEIKRGQRLTSISSLASETSLSIKNIRTSIKRLKTTNEVASYSTAQHTVFTMVNYDLYQDEASEVANKGQAKGKQRATNNNDKNEKNENKEILSLINDVFAHWWNLYPSSRRKNKGGCLTKFKAKCKNLDEDQIIELVDKMSADVARRVKEIDDIKFLPTTEPYINQERWMDEE
tara:strand:- start:129 stop:782 length:654 start_codon:yes stop_codon:yes gene_type:complete